MASEPKDFSHPKSDPDSVHEPDREADCEDRRAGETGKKIDFGDAQSTELAPPDGEGKLSEPPGAAQDAASVEDEELLEMLEQLSQTIDTANNALAGQNEFAFGAAHSAPPAPSEFLPPPPPPPPAKRRRINPFLAVSAGVLLGVGALAVFWPLWNPPSPPSSEKLVKAQGRVTETVISRSSLPAAAPPRASAEPPPAQAALAPVKAFEPPDYETAAMAEFAAASPKTPIEPAAIAEEKKPDLPSLTAQEETQLLARGKTLTATGDVSSARLAYEYAARRSSVDAMFALAQTYDPEMLAAWSVVGIQPDMGAALKWYGRAADLGHDRAGNRKRELEKLTDR